MSTLEREFSTGLSPNFQSSSQRTLLHCCAKYNRVDTASLCIQRGAYCSPVNLYGSTPLHIAAKLGYSEMCEFLIQRGAKIDLQDNAGFTPIHLAAMTNNYQCVVILLNAGANHGICSFDMNSPLHTVVQMSLDEMAALLCLNGADLDKKNRLDQTPIQLAQSKALPVYPLLESQRKGFAFLSACGKNDLGECEKLLLEEPSLLQFRDKHGQTGLMVAADKKSELVVAFLLNNGADHSTRDNRGRDAWDIAHANEASSPKKKKKKKKKKSTLR
eukprot:TRINITY_DN6751_c0_g1_i1.p1 TRINITY_DN6751_c0_g1~~TRINITY_DN6751_c0_g1_i1.p1  ORF type:complete len:273 (-),score=58.81 TRINITY_DN6751_c0_g1_i1:35-853(-)